jgi:CubicO group peptidase (beta-lactamase class C family)
MTSGIRILVVAGLVYIGLLAGFQRVGYAQAAAAPSQRSTASAEGSSVAGAFSPDRLRRITDFVDRRIAAGEIPGAVTLIAHRGTIVHFDVRGVMSLDTRQPLSKDTLFQIASMTKPITAAAVLMLIEEGRLRLMDPVSRFIPQFKAAAGGQSSDGEVTIRHLLTHTSGLVAPFRPAPEIETLATFLPTFATAPREFQPGTRWVYNNNVAFDSLARIVEIVSGQNYDQFLRERIFTPLQMNDTFHNVPPAEMSRLATRYDVTANGLRPRPAPPASSYFGGGGGLKSTAADYLRFAQMLLNRGELDGKRLLGPRTVDLMRAVHVPDTFPGRRAGESWGLGVRVITDAAARDTWLSNGSFGWTGATGTHFWIDPDNQIIGIMMIAAPAAAIRPDFETLVMQAFVAN